MEEDEDLHVLSMLDEGWKMLEDDEEVIIPVILNCSVERSPSLFRQRWASSYLLNLAAMTSTLMAGASPETTTISDILLVYISVNEQ